MNSYLLNRQFGSISQQAFSNAQHARALRSLHLDENVSFVADAKAKVAHATGVSSICIDRFEGRYLLSGGADSSLAIWDLEQDGGAEDGPYHPLSFAANTSNTASLGITQVSFYPFDSLAFLTSGYDQTLKLFSSETLKPSAKFELGSIVYSHAASNVGHHLLIACATQHPAIRLVDLRSGASAHALAGHIGSVLTVAWHPRDENILASGATDGVVRLWDIRKSANSLGVLDMDDSIGIAGYDGMGTGARRRERGKAHAGATSGLVWTDDGHYLVSSGTDERMRVWDMSTGANTLANFGPAVKNARNTVLLPMLAPGHLLTRGAGMVFFPNPNEILSFDLHSGDPLQRLRAVDVIQDKPAEVRGMRNMKSHTTSLAWRAHHLQMFSAHTNGVIRGWSPKTWEDEAAEEELDEVNGKAEEQSSRKRKRDELEQIVRDLTTKKVTYI